MFTRQHLTVPCFPTPQKASLGRHRDLKCVSCRLSPSWRLVWSPRGPLHSLEPLSPSSVAGSPPPPPPGSLQGFLYPKGAWKFHKVETSRGPFPQGGAAGGVSPALSKGALPLRSAAPVTSVCTRSVHLRGCSGSEPSSR